MTSRILTTLISISCLAAAGTALADCGASGTLAGTRKAYQSGQQLERAGNASAAFAAYIEAQEPTCEPNPIEIDAARRAAALALPLGAAAEKNGDFEHAFRYYEDGGQYAAADRALMKWVRARPDDPSVFAQARETLDARTLPAFENNNQVRLSITGAYQPDPRNLAEVLAMPAKGAERAFAQEAQAFDEQYLREYVQVIQSRPDDPTDFDALQASANVQQAFAQKWGQDRLKGSRDALSLVQSWIGVSSDRAWSERTQAQRHERLEQRVATLTKSYPGAPELLEAAIDYVHAMNLERADTRVGTIEAQAGRLGDEASAKHRPGLAAEYYDVARQEAKARAEQERSRQQAMAKMQPSIDQMQRQAAQIQKVFSDPAKVKAMQEQARALQRSLQEQQKAKAAGKTARPDDLEKELGL
jgi:hypothetical protein